MGKWTKDDKTYHDCNGEFITFQHCQYAEALFRAHNADCDAYEAKIAELESRLARIAALASTPGWADIVKAGGRLELTTDRLDAIRAILEDESNAD